VAVPSLPTPFSTPTKNRITNLKLAPPSPIPSPLRSFPNLYSHAHYLLSTNLTATDGSPLLAGREGERQWIRRFLSSRFPAAYPSGLTPAPSEPRIQWNNAPTMYISGQPGLGKTALLMSELAEFRRLVKAQRLEDEVCVGVENCATLGGSEGSVWARLARGLGMEVKAGAVSAKDGKAAFELGLEQGGQYLLILDEIDSLLSATNPSTSTAATQTIMHTLFVMAHAPGSNLTLIGIANALNLAATELASALDLSASPTKGKAKQTSSLASLGPQLLSFLPYTAPELAHIVEQRLSSLHPTYPVAREDLAADQGRSAVGATAAAQLFAPGALRMLSMRIAPRNGDVRRMLGAAQYALAAAETRQRAKGVDLGRLTVGTVEDKVTMADSRAAFERGEAKQATEKVENRLTELPWPNRLALVGVVIALSRVPPSKNPGTEEVPLSAAFEAYRLAMTKQNSLGTKFSKTEFEGALSVLEGHAFLAIRSSSYSSSPPRKAHTRKAKPTISGDPNISLSPSQESLSHLIQGLKLTPSGAGASDGSLSEAALRELLQVTRGMLEEEERRVERLRPKGMLKDAMAPREGFTGRGLQEGPAGSPSGGRRRKAATSGWMGEKKRGGREEEHEADGVVQKLVQLDSDDE